MRIASARAFARPLSSVNAVSRSSLFAVARLRFGIAMTIATPMIASVMPTSVSE